jgi:segregation and condensation protein B
MTTVRDDGTTEEAGDVVLVSSQPEVPDEEQLAPEPSADEELQLQELAPASIESPEPIEPATPADKLAARAKGYSAAKVRKIVESLLLVAEAPLTTEQICKVSGIDSEVLKDALAEIKARFSEKESGIVLVEVAGGWQLRTSPDATSQVRRFLQVKPQRLTRAALETLAIVAYRQPVTRADVEDVRGVDSGAILKALIERKLVRILGRKEEPGRPILYGTSKEFLEFFSLKDLASLPTLREFQELSEESRKIVEDETGEKPGIEGLVSDLADRSLMTELEATAQEAESALEEMEQAMATAEERSKVAAEILGPPPGTQVPGEEPEASAADANSSSPADGQT